MNLRNAKNYSIGLSITPQAVGWSVTDEEGTLYHFKGKPTWGTRTFPRAETAQDTRMARGMRRRLTRRRQRLDALQGFFLNDMAKVDPDFFVRLRQSRLVCEDRSESLRDSTNILFNSDEFSTREFKAAFPTIYHLRYHLMTSDEKADLRLVYLALHHIVKYRGNFLHDSEGDSFADGSDTYTAANLLVSELQTYLLETRSVDAAIEPDIDAIASDLDSFKGPRSARLKSLSEHLGGTDKESKGICTLVARACLDYSTNFAKLFDIEKQAGTSFPVSEDEAASSFADELCPDEGRPLFDAIRNAHSAYVLSDILMGHESISEAMIASYERHHQDLRTLKALFHDHLPAAEYRTFFRGSLDDRGGYDINKVKKGTYTSYVMGEKRANGLGTSHDELIAAIRSLVKKHPEIAEDPRYGSIRDRIESPNGDFLLKQRTRQNIAIPYQLHLKELNAIIDRQGSFYPFLAEHKAEIAKIVSSRIPYYVGPLNGGHDPLGYYPQNKVDPTRKFAWSVRKPGMEHAKAYPWNIDEVIDSDRTAELFIKRMTGTCTYLVDEPVLPKRSLLYEEFCVLNELNGLKWCKSGGQARRFDHVDKTDIFNELCRDRFSANVSISLIKSWLTERYDMNSVDVFGSQNDKELSSKLSTYHDFCKIFGVRNLESECPLSFDELEELVLWNTVFEDRSILLKKIVETYGPEGDGRMTTAQIKKFVGKRYTGWGKLSRKFLTEVRVPAPVSTGFVSIMDVLRDGDPTSRLHTTLLNELLFSRTLDFSSKIDEINNAHIGASGRTLTVDEAIASPADRRPVNQALRVIDEISGIVGEPPARICLQVIKDNGRGKGNQAKSRYKNLHDIYLKFKVDKTLVCELSEYKDKLNDDRLLLYFEQLGRCMYTGRRLDITQLGKYRVDYITPRAYYEDKSLDNRALVTYLANVRKSDSLYLSDSVIDSQTPHWSELCRMKLISERKLRRLTSRQPYDRDIEQLVSRQLRDSSRTTKAMRLLCAQRYPASEIVPVRQDVIRGVQTNIGLPRTAIVNNSQPAHDAYTACQVSAFVEMCYPDWREGVTYRAFDWYLSQIRNAGTGYTHGRSGFVADSMTTLRHLDYDTGEIVWSGEDFCEHMRKVFAYKSCFVSRMPEVSTGAFWDATVYSPRDKTYGKNLQMPLKSSARKENAEGLLEPRKYGGPRAVKKAFFFAFTARDARGREKIFFEGVPIYLAGKSAENLLSFAQDIAAKKGYSGVRILRSFIPLRQKFEINGIPYYLGGSTSGYNIIQPARELYPDYGTQFLVNRLFTSEDLDDEDCNHLYDWLVEACDILSPKLSDILLLRKRTPLFRKLALDDKNTQLVALVRKFCLSAQVVDIKRLGGSTSSGSLTIATGSVFPSIVWIDPSVTGMFERRVSYSDLKSNPMLTLPSPE